MEVREKNTTPKKGGEPLELVSKYEEQEVIALQYVLWENLGP